MCVSVDKSTDLCTTEAFPNATSIPDDTHKKARLRATYSSFGRNGLTATANAYGHLLQITQYFGNEPSGFISVDLPTTTEPQFVAHRVKDLDNQSIDPSKGIRLLFQMDHSHISANDIWDTNPKTLRTMQARALPSAPSSNLLSYDVPAPAPAWVQESKPALKFVHNRWPHFSTRTPGFDMNIQYYISGKSVYQTYKFTLRPGLDIFSPIPKIAINAHLLLRDLDFVTPENDINKYDPKNPNANYSCGISSDGYCVVRSHTNCDLKDGRDAIVLFISPFINGCRQQPVKLPQPCLLEELDNYFVIPDKQAQDRFMEDGTLEITLAYTLQLVSSNFIETAACPVSEADLQKAAEQANKGAWKEMPVTKSRQLDFALKRNLEHILSVCSIPMKKGLKEDIPAIALTCGDLSGHRVAGKASFFAFQFLLLAFRHFQSLLQEECSCKSEDYTCKDYSRRMQKRILRVCWGHLKWLFLNTNEDEDFSPHRWSTGKAIINWESNQSLPKQSVIDASFDIIKVTDFYKIAASSKQKEEIHDDLEGIVGDWIQDLHQKNQNNEYVFPHFMEDTPQRFHLADHAMIWRTLKSLEHLGFNSELRVGIGPGRHKIRYSSKKIHDSILKKFTVHCTQLDERMVATSRSLSETSFLLQIEDTATIYATKMGLFDHLKTDEEPADRSNNASTDDLVNVSTEMLPGGLAGKSGNESVDPWEKKNDSWIATINSQELHEDNDEDSWDQPLQYALAMILSTKSKPVNSQSPAQTYSFAKSKLLKSSSPNGLFPGELDDNKEPVIFEDDDMRDSYWHTTFEVPYILWEEKEFSRRVEGNDSQESLSATLQRRNSTEAPISVAGFVKKYEPFTQIMDQKSVAGSSYEWLYKKPQFFGFHIDLSPKVVTAFSKKHSSNNSGKGFGTIDRAVVAAGHSSSDDKEDLEDLGYIIDVSGIEYAKSLGQRIFSHSIFSSKSIRSFIGGSRDPTNAKKRFFHFYRANLNVALNCYLASSEEEEISSFFNKHASYSKYFFEDTTTILNKWVTELHLSFYQVLPKDQSLNTIPSQEKFKFPTSTRGEQTKWIIRAVMSFRFDGDLFDHYWTCHFFDYSPQWMAGSKAGRQWIDKMPIGGTLETDPWQQRRILELIIFDLILQEMLEGTKGILEEIMTSVLKGHGSDNDGIIKRLAAKFSDIDASTLLEALEVLSTVDSNTFALKNELWNKFQRILQVIEDDLKENLAIIELWTSRENKIEVNKLGWTPRREQRYQGAISRLKLSNGHKIHELKRCCTNVSSFNMLLTRRLEVMRNDLDTRSNVDIRLFTYVTVVFLPVSFATGVFSMSSAPTKETLSSMASTAGVALVITIVALLNARVLDSEIFRPIFHNFPVLSLLSILPATHLSFLHRASKSQPPTDGDFFDREIRRTTEKIVKKRSEGELIEKEKSGKRESRITAGGGMLEKQEKVEIQIPDKADIGREGSRTGDSSNGTIVISNEEVNEMTTANTRQRVRHWFGLESKKLDGPIV
ncbi:hypothetical protein V8C42DRAFT_357450 [Trichoderma barbatum]